MSNTVRTKGDIIREIQRIAANHDGQPPGIRTFGMESGFPRSSWEGTYWSKWSDALAEAGFTPNQRNQKFENQTVFMMLVDACRHYQRKPSLADMRLYRRTVNADFPISAIVKRFGADALWTAFAEWLSNQNGRFVDVVSMLPEFQVTSESESEVLSQSRNSDGLVYLLKSGDFYKIGRSEDIERRVKEVRTQMPESLKLVHSIRTDDPSGIEKYWHDRFRDKRANGEWFKLTRADVVAFQRRKYQ